MAGRKHPFIPEFHSEDEEREFWEQVDLVKFIECPADEIVLELRPKGRRRKKSLQKYRKMRRGFFWLSNSMNLDALVLGNPLSWLVTQSVLS
jgi:hypothetical protein